MFPIKVQTTQGIKREYVYGKDELDTQIFFEKSMLRPGGRKKDRVNYYNVVCAFDIEITSIDTRPTDPEERKKYKGEAPYGFMYLWQFAIEDRVYMGRTWEEFLDFTESLTRELELSHGQRIIVWVHNLAFEFQFISRFFNWDMIFAKDVRKVIKCCTTGGIEFRCSYFLSNMSFEKLCENTHGIVYYKNSGKEFDYTKIRTPKTSLTDEEYSYAYCDVRGLVEAIHQFLKDDTLVTIPLTNTGFVRRDCRNACAKNHEQFNRTKMTAEQIEFMQSLKRGGNTHGCRFYATKILHDMRCFDFASSYPFELMTDYYPDSVFTKVENLPDKEHLDKYLDTYCCMVEMVLYDLKIHENESIPYMAVSRTELCENGELFNGRVLSADKVVIRCTEIDYRIIEEQYSFSKMACTQLYFAERGEIQTEIKEEIRKYYFYKTTLKKKDPYLYAKSKNRLNSIFGMMFTNPIHDEIVWSDGEWHVEKGTAEEQLEKYYNSRNSFLPIQHGVWVTAHAREHLQELIKCSGELTVYCDTDSNKCLWIDEKKLKALNDKAIKEAEEHKAYADFEGKRYYMGVAEEEDSYKDFVTCGAKKYAYTLEDGGLHITVAGVRKSGASELKNIENFHPGFVFRENGGTVSWYNDEDVHQITVEGVTFTTGANIAILPTEYTLGITDEFAGIISNFL